MPLIQKLNDDEFVTLNHIRSYYNYMRGHKDWLLSIALSLGRDFADIWNRYISVLKHSHIILIENEDFLI